MNPLPGWRLDPRMHLSRCPIFGVHFYYLAKVVAGIQFKDSVEVTEVDQVAA